GIDVGGTFTDYVLQDEQSGELITAKHPTRPSDLAGGILEGLSKVLDGIGTDLQQVSQAIHATTIASNLIVERKGAPTGLITTEGFRDVLLIQRQLRVNIYDLFLDKPQPLLPRALIREVSERITHDGKVWKELDEGSVVEAVRELLRDGVGSFAVALLHSYANPSHERRVGELVLREAPDALVTLSSDVSPQWRVYERSNTAVANAYIMPAVRSYLGRLEDEMQKGGYQRDLYVMQANGGIATAGLIMEEPVRVIESGPAAGALMAANYGRVLGFRDLISFDMGGTTAKVCLIEDGRPATTSQVEIDRMKMQAGSGLPINIPGIDLVEIGAGGGSIARARMGVVTVGPDSAGADPGPICYGLGGDEPTVTDADLVLGYLNPDYFLGGRMGLDSGAAIEGIEKRVSGPLGVSVEAAAWGIHQMVNTNMMRAIRLATVERGRDPRKYTFVAFGGAGPVHGCRLARELGVSRIVLPAAAGVASAIGLLAADISFDLAMTYAATLNEEILDPVNAIFEELTSRGRSMLEEAGADKAISLVTSADMHYVGQGYEISVPVASTPLTVESIALLEQAFHRTYQAVFGYSQPDQQVEVTGWKLKAVSSPGTFALPTAPDRGTGARDGFKGKRRAYFPESGGYVETAIYDRYALTPGSSIEGPAIVEEAESTTVLLPGDRARVDDYLNLIVELGG
ncbi:MAG: hydantoinase/oxoprolinase family protein, partial [Chloroflexi bacterium]|nr:hydantoinase/oxoprolinase family protein [Chloroflexota bacterium]